MNLWEVADFLKKNGVINAINLDGGGSSSFVINGSLASYPPDQWWVRVCETKYKYLLPEMHVCLFSISTDTKYGQCVIWNTSILV